eukprot:m.150390 g.150390  ORF g.150390 m.150390 type:complete len:71 (+) comp16175_c2_seq1:872-1084(+)
MLELFILTTLRDLSFEATQLIPFSWKAPRYKLCFCPQVLVLIFWFHFLTIFSFSFFFCVVLFGHCCATVN